MLQKLEFDLLRLEFSGALQDVTERIVDLHAASAQEAHLRDEISASTQAWDFKSSAGVAVYEGLDARPHESPQGGLTSSAVVMARSHLKCLSKRNSRNAAVHVGKTAAARGMRSLAQPPGKRLRGDTLRKRRKQTLALLNSLHPYE